MAAPLPTTGDAAAAAAALDRAAILAEAADDPALAACCVRDLEGQARAERVKARLAAADRVEARVRAAAAPAPLAGHGGDDDDGALASIRAARLAQLQAEAAARKGGRGRGTDGGTLADLSGAKALWRLVEGQQGGGGGGEAAAAAGAGATTALPPPVPPIIAHLYVPGAPGGAATDELLAGLAAEHAAAARFVRVRVDAPGVAAGAGLPGRGGVPVLVAFRGGALVAKAPVAAFMGEAAGPGGEDGPDEARVVAWLRAARALPKTARGGGQGGASSSDQEDDEGDADGDPCPECGRTYAHEHVRSTRAGGVGGAGGGRRVDSSEEEEEED